MIMVGFLRLKLISFEGHGSDRLFQFWVTIFVMLILHISKNKKIALVNIKIRY